MTGTQRGRSSPNRPLTWRKMDLHLHTPASADYKDKGVTYLQILQRAEARGLDIIAITDHNTVAGCSAMRAEIEGLELLERLGRLSEEEKKTLAEYRRLGAKVLVLPGLEVTATLGFHILGVFPPDTSIRKLEHLLLGLNVPEEKLELGSGEVGATADVLSVYRALAEAGGLVIAAHANSSHGVALQGFDFGGQTKIAYTQDRNLHALEVTDLESSSRRSTAAFFSGSKPEYPRRMHCIQGSDAHHLDRNPRDKSSPWGVGDRVTEVAVPEIGFQALKEVFLGDDFARTRPYRPAAEAPFDHIKAARQQGPNIVQSFHETFSPKPSRLGTIIYDIVAFANTNGGTVYLGVGANPRGPVLGVDKPDEVMALLHDEIHKSVTPPMEVAMDVKTSDGRKVIEIKVPGGKETPYVLSTGQIYVRQESETSLAMRDEIIRLVERRSAPAPLLGKEMPLAPPAPKAVEAPMPVEPVALLDVAPPRTGVEVLEAEERENVTYYTVQDLRNGNVVRNVTRFSARHLWHYAITEREARPIREGDVTWQGNIGLWKTYQRAGVKRYNLVQRDREGKLHVYYGVTEEGIHGEWRVFLEGEKAQPQ